SLVAVCSLELAAHAAPKPNFIFFLIDDLGRNDLGCYGSKFYRTPNLDRMAAQGVKFSDAYSACPVCSPTRASIMTGKYPARLHLTDWLPGRGDRPDHRLARPQINQQLALDEVTIAERLKAAGYVTAHVGKWHLGGEGFEPQKQGFDINIAGDSTGTPRSYFAPFGGKGKEGKFISMTGLADAKDGEYLTDRLTTEAEKIIAANKDKPFFLYFAHYAVHTPLRAKADYIAKYPQVAGKAGQQTNAIYAAMMESMDESIGRILKQLDDLKLADNTYVFFTSDNGGLATLEGPGTPATINSPLREGKGYLYEGGIRVPLLVRGPGIAPGSTATNAMSSVDYLPTIVELAGLAAPKPTESVDGVTLAPLLKGTGAPAARPLFWHYPHYANQGGKPGGVIRDGDWKLIEFYETGRVELFDLKNDFRENRNLAEDPTHAARVKTLVSKLDTWRIRTGAQMMQPNRAYRPSPQAPSGNITMLGKDADVFGAMLRFEPLPHKNTLGFWVNPTDWASWDFEVVKPGKFTMEITYGCGNGSGGSEVEFAVGPQKLLFKVEQTGGFQAFVKRDIGEMTFDKPGRYTLTVKPKSKPGPAVMDLPQVVLKAGK
ncbi:MAG: sulfatase-like hydrolase/transferase, partial [Limisphaerales bacterium]